MEPDVATPDHEFELRLERRVDGQTGQELLDLVVETVREFASYGYRLDLRGSFEVAARSITIEVGGVSLPSIATASPGRARGVSTIAMPADGEYQVRVVRKQRSAEFRIVIAKGIPAPLIATEGGFIRLVG